MQIRAATVDDLAAIDDLYNHYVTTSTCTYQKDPGTLDERRAWFAAHDAAHPVTVADDAGVVVGFGSLSPFRERWGYRHTVENTVYVRHDQRGRGIGRLLLDDLIARAIALGHHTIIAGVDGEQAASLALHRAAGFVEVGRFREVGHKFDRWLDVVFLQRSLSVPRSAV